MKDFLYFNSMLTPKIITFVYWLLLFLVVVSGIGAMFKGYSGFTFAKFLLGIGTIVVGALAVRIWCELTIVWFKIYENVKKMAEKEE